jgi:hypothetical protein
MVVALSLIQRNNDETLPIIKKSKHPKKRGIQGTKTEGPVSKKIKESSKETKPQRNIKFSNPLLSREAYQIMKREDALK